MPQTGSLSDSDKQSSSFFNIPSVLDDKEYDDKSNTEVAWTRGYFGLIHFVAWEDFENKVWSPGMRSFREIPENMKASARLMMDAARSQIIEGNKEVERIKEETGQLSSEDSSEEESSSDGNETDESAPSNEIEQQDVGVFTNCASVKPMMDSVSVAVQSLLRASLTTDPLKRRYYVRCKNELDISTLKLKNSFGYSLRLPTPQNIRVDVGVVLGVVKKGRKRKTPDSPEKTRAPAKFNVGGILPICSYEMKGPTLDLTGIAAISKLKSSQVPSIEGNVDDPPDASNNGEDSNGSTRANITDSVLPSEGSTNDSFGMNESGVDGNESAGARNIADESNRGGNTTDLVDASKAGGNNIESADAHVTGGEANELTGTSNAENQEALSSSQGTTVYTAKEVAEAFNFLFSKSRFIDKRSKEGGPIRSSIYRISQAVTYAVLSLGGCSFLYNLKSGIALHVVSCNDKTLTVEVTGVLLPDQAPNCGSAMFAIAKYCMDRYFEDGAEDLSSQVREAARKVADQAFDADSDGADTSDGEYSPTEDRKYVSDSGSSSHENHSNSGGSAEATDSQRDMSLRLNSLRIKSPANLRKTRSYSNPLTENFNSKHVNRTIDESIKNMMMNYVDVLGSGSSAVVIRSKFLKTDVAVKIPFDSSPNGKRSLAHEIMTYLELQREDCPLLGDVLPRLVLAWNAPQQNSVYNHMTFLVTEFVGRGLTRNRRGQLCVGDTSSGYEVIGEKDEQQICESAIQGLRRMREYGLYHGDVAMRNLRVERVRNQAHVTWKTWWVDLGCSAICESIGKTSYDTSLHETDMIEVSALFNS